MAQTAARTPGRPEPGDGFVQSFARGLDVIRSFGADAPAQTLSEVATRSGLTRAGARRILLTLQHLGYVETDGRLYHLTARILDLGYAYLSSMPMWDLAQPVMERLSEQTGESCSVAVLDGSDIVYVMRVYTHKIVSLNLSVGTRLPAYCTSMGRLLLSALPEEVALARLRAAPLPARTRQTCTEVDAVMARVRQVRQQGWAMVNEELEEGLISLAAPVRDRQGRVIAALNVSGQTRRTSAAVMRENVLPVLQTAADEVSQLLRNRG